MGEGDTGGGAAVFITASPGESMPIAPSRASPSNPNAGAPYSLPGTPTPQAGVLLPGGLVGEKLIKSCPAGC